VPLDCVRAMLDAPLGRAPRASASDDALAELLAGLPEALRGFAAEVVALAREYTALDDLEHYHTTRLARPLRRGVHALGARLARRGVLREAADLFFARVATVDAAALRLDAASLGALAAEAAAGRASYDVARRASPVWQLGAPAAAPLPEGAQVLTGTAGSAGVAEGVVYVVHDADDFARFPRGAVLVARTTNPAWTPLFYSAAAVITESGGALSHGAVTAREMGIPAVMAVRGATALAAGTRVRVDGTAGRVSVLADAPTLAAV
jgi:pyruvate,water dikinase